MLAAALAAAPNGLANAAEAGGASNCTSKTGALNVTDLPSGTSVVDCGFVGRVVSFDGRRLTIPPAGEGVGVEAILVSGGTSGFHVEVSSTGTISYDVTGEQQSSSSASTSAFTYAVDDEDFDDTSDAGVTSTSACSDGAHSGEDLMEYDTYNWYVGDGAMPGAMTQSEAHTAFADAINNITGSYNNCGYSDTVSATAAYQGTTTYEADINSSGDCTDRDGKSTWDAGNLDSGTVAETCWWDTSYLGMENDLKEADVRYNTTDLDFTNSPTSSCTSKYDIRSVGTHEAGHVFGLGHVGSGHSNLTMYTNSFLCSTKARTLGKGDILGLRDIY
ncbi:matrixin family metalloprotease [Streptomyces sp. NBC_01537]|uniref:matrixin family metalloprotease n=1 Tax=Streptomyces sp. NBC_01537 TaxID=2903896 RepID=UPI003870BB66